LGRARFTFEGLDSIERRLRRVGTDASHVMVWDRTERAAEENLGRFDLTPGTRSRTWKPGWTPDHIDDAVSIDDPTDDEPVDTELADAMDEDDDERRGARSEMRRPRPSPDATRARSRRRRSPRPRAGGCATSRRATPSPSPTGASA
jgi:hypothetical protein